MVISQLCSGSNTLHLIPVRDLVRHHMVNGTEIDMSGDLVFVSRATCTVVVQASIVSPSVSLGFSETFA